MLAFYPITQNLQTLVCKFCASRSVSGAELNAHKIVRVFLPIDTTLHSINIC